MKILVNIFNKIKWFFFPSSRKRNRFYGKSLDIFLNRNFLLWKKLNQHSHPNPNEFVLVSQRFYHASDWIIAKNITASILANIKNVTPLVLLERDDDDKTRLICESYFIKHFISVYEKKIYFLTYIKSFLVALNCFFQIKTPQQLTKYKFKNILIGDLVYDTWVYLTYQGSMKKLSFTVFKSLFNTVFYYYRLHKIFSSYSIKYLVLESEERTCNHGLIVRYALEKGISCFILAQNETRMALTRYNSFEELLRKMRLMKPSLELVKMYENNQQLRQKAINRCNEFLNIELFSKQFSQNLHIAHDPNRPIYTKEQLIKEFNLDPEKPIVVIMSHIFIDVPHAQGNHIFMDYMDWYKKTLLYIRKLDHVNWLIKPHPTSNSNYKRSKHTAEGVYYEILNDQYSHIKLLPDKIRTNSFFNFTNAFVSCMGSIGFESACYGIPTLQAAEGPNTGFGFTIDSHSEEEYYKNLENIHTFKLLPPEKVERAKIVYSLYSDFLYLETNLMPPCGYAYKKLRHTDEFWNSLAQINLTIEDISNLPFYKNMKIFFESTNTHLIDNITK